MVKLIEFSSDAPGDETESGVSGFFAALTRIGVSKAIPNLKARLGAIVGAGTTLPYVVSVDGGGRGYVGSFTRMYMDGAADELGSSKNALLRLAAPGVAVSGHAARALGMDEIVTVNNNLHSTVHVPDWTGIDIGAMTAALIAKYPRHAIWVRGMTDRLNADDLARLKAQDYVIAPSRPVEILDPSAPDYKVSSNLKKDFKRLERIPGMTSFIGGAFSDTDFAAMERFCHSATVERHTKLLPNYTAAFFAACAAWSDCRILGLRDDGGALRGFATLIIGPTRITCGTLGYDMDAPDAKPIYPALSGMEMREAINARLPFNIGYGAVDFKRVRGTVPAMETNAFYIRHLPAVRRRLWATTLSAMSSMAGAVLKRL
ncbi:MAG: hypothetical protein GC190_09300 [Alphaproteobacteria bacterium]|nr:hypothetical protein [Alphaproteobacteria bacterium]